jgi:acyl carrier protein
MASSKATIEERVANIIAEQLGVSVAEVKPETSFVNDLGADSLDVIEITMAIEDEFDLNIADEDAETFTTTQTIIDHVKANIREPITL